MLTPPISNEGDFVNRSVNAFQNFWSAGGRQYLSTRSIKIDKKPIVDFMPFSPAFPFDTKKEIGDLLFVYKYFLKNKLVAHRASIVQAKYTKGTGTSWKVDTSQFYLMNYWPNFHIIKPKPRKFKTYDLTPKTRSWATYGFVGPNAIAYPLFFSARRMLDVFRMPSSDPFYFNLNLMPAIWVYGAGFLSLLLQNLVGENLLNNLRVKNLVDDLYKIAGMLPDPPEEFEWNDEQTEEGKSFGIIEFKIVEERGREQT